jgi:apolipoprotein N-acyltransferase
MCNVFSPESKLIERSREWAERIGSLRGWRRNAVALVFGLLATLALAPFFFVPLLVVSFTGLLWLINGAHSRRRAFWDGWWWGWGFFISGMYWMNIALLVDVDKLWWMVPEALFGLTAYLAVYSGVACWLTIALRTRGLSRIIVFSAVWVGMEYVRGAIIAEFPWNLIGYSFGFSDAALQLASVVGIYGLSWFVALLGGSFAAIGDETISIKRSVGFVVVLWAAFAGSMCFGEWRLHQAEQLPEANRYVEGVLLRLVQPNLNEGRKLDSKAWDQIFQEEVQLTHSGGLENVTHVIWPESTIPYPLHAEKALPAELSEGLPEGKMLIAGTDRLELRPRPRLFNSLVAISEGRKIIAFYDMGKLVPWGEYIPWQEVIPRTLLSPIVSRPDFGPGAMRLDYSPGTGPRTLSLPGLPAFAPMICYEVIFPERASVPDHPPQWLLAITNDAWFGQSTGPYQHFEMARLRAIEQGMPMIIAGNTGISASIDPYGRVLASLGLGQRGILDVELPKSIAGGTVYGRYGEWFLFSLLSGTAFLMAWRRLRSIKSKSSQPCSS